MNRFKILILYPQYHPCEDYRMVCVWENPGYKDSLFQNYENFVWMYLLYRRIMLYIKERINFIVCSI